MVFTTNCPEGFIPNTPCKNDENGLAALVVMFEANAIEEKKNSWQAPTRKKRKLMSPDDDITLAKVKQTKLEIINGNPNCVVPNALFGMHCLEHLICNTRCSNCVRNALFETH